MEHKFKIGSRVWVDTIRGREEGVVLSHTITFNTASYVVEIKTKEGAYQSFTCFPPSLTPVEAASEPETPRRPFKPGDHVRVLSKEMIAAWRGELRASPRMFDLCGKIITVEKHDPQDNTYKAAGYWWMADWLEPAEMHNSATPFYTAPASQGTVVAAPSELPLINTTKLLTNIKLD